jgi:hypothetical protein
MVNEGPQKPPRASGPGARPSPPMQADGVSRMARGRAGIAG